MADIGIQEKKRSIWPWVLLALAVALILWWFLSQRDDGRDVTTGADAGYVAPAGSDTLGTGAAAGAAAGGAVAAFMAHVQRNADGTMGADHQYTAAGLRQLADAIREVNTGGTQGAGQDIGSQLDILRVQADSLERNAQSNEHARMTREAMVTGATALEMLQRNRAPNAAEHVSQVRQSAEAVRPGTQLLEQRQHVKAFFDHAATALRTITGQAT